MYTQGDRRYEKEQKRITCGQVGNRGSRVFGRREGPLSLINGRKHRGVGESIDYRQGRTRHMDTCVRIDPVTVEGSVADHVLSTKCLYGIW